MYISKLQLRNFRNYEYLELPLENNIYIFTGENAQGKTNLLEAAALLSTGKSHRTARDRDMIRINEPFARVKAASMQADGEHTVDVVLSRSEKKRVLLNGLPISRIGDMIGQIKSVMFSPEDLDIIKSGPSQRRRFMDLDRCQMKKSYFYALNTYNHVLEQRNHLLKLTAAKEVENTLFIWDEKLAEAAQPIMAERKRFVEKLSPLCESFHSELSGGKETLKAIYEPSVEGEEGELKEKLLNTLRVSWDRDIKNKVTGNGPHKDDIAFKLGDKDLRWFGSQGQQRTAALALKLAQLELIKEELGEYPVLLLDDVLSELDVSRQERLLGRLKGIQALITAAELSESLKKLPARIIKVKEGKLYF